MRPARVTIAGLGPLHSRRFSGQRPRIARSRHRGSGAESSRKTLERLVGPDEAERQITLARTALVDARTIKLPRLVPGAARAHVSLLMAADGRITQVRFIKGDERLRAGIATLKALKAPALQPDVQTMSFVRHGVVGCSPTGCVLVLLRPADAPPPPGVQ